MFFLSLGLSTALLVIVNAVAAWRGRRGTTVALVVGVLACAWLFCAGIPAVMLNAILLGIALAAWWAFGTRPRWFLISSSGVTVAAYLLVTWFVALPEVREWELLKAEYPMQSLAGRLAYEGRTLPHTHAPAYDVQRLTRFEAALDKRGGEGGAYWRVHCLERLHAGAVEQFVNSPGFGVVRMLHPGPRRLRWFQEDEDGAAPGPVPQRSRPYPAPEPPPESVAVGDDDFARAHMDNGASFLNPFDSGYVRDREHVVGFRPHQFAASRPLRSAGRSSG